MKKMLLLILIFSMTILVGCGSLIDLKQSSEVIKNFLTENPDADITINTWSADEIAENQDKVTLICGKMLEEKPYYYVLIEEKEQKIEAFLDFDTGKAVCVKRIGLKDDENEKCSELSVEQCYKRSDCEIEYRKPSCIGDVCTTEMVPMGCRSIVDCGLKYDPVCGENFKTYSNKCFASLDKVEIAYEGECKPETKEKINEKQVIELVKQYFHKQWYKVSDGCGNYNDKTGMMEPLSVYIKETLGEGGRTTYLVYAETYCGWNYNTGKPSILRYSVTANGDVYEEGPTSDQQSDKIACEKKGGYWNECPMQTCPEGQACIQVCGEPICEEKLRYPIELPPPEITSETIKCVFKNSKEEQKCYSEEFACSGTEACNVEVKGEYGKILTLKSSCGGYAYITLDGTGNYDGRGEYAEFECSLQTTMGSTSAGQ